MSDINFSKLTWENLPARTTALSATNLNRIEKGIDDSVNGVNANAHDIAELRTEVGALANGSPTPVATVVEMTDESAVYLYTGSESGYTAGNWYYYDGSAWTSGGTYGGATTSTTFNQHGVPADDFAVGDALAEKADADDVTALDTRVTETNNALLNYQSVINPFNIHNFIDASGLGDSTTSGGIRFNFTSVDTCEISGTATSNTFKNIYVNQQEFPTWAEKGKKYSVKYAGVDESFRVYA